MRVQMSMWIYVRSLKSASDDWFATDAVLLFTRLCQRKSSSQMHSITNPKCKIWKHLF
jgi:hypothetical protein